MQKKSSKMLCAFSVTVIILCIMAKGYMEKDLAVSHLTQGMDSYISVETDKGVREIAFEDYVMGVTARQIQVSSGIEVLKAQMVIVRTNLYKKMQDNPEELLSEPYFSMRELERMGIAGDLQEAEETTSGQVLKVEEELVRIPYHSVSAGKTREGAEVLPEKGYDWLTSAECTNDYQSPEYLSIEIWKPEKLKKMILESYPESLTDSESVEEQLEIIKRDSGDYVTEIRIGRESISGEAFRQSLGLASSCFYLEEITEGIRITVKGVGHGLGMSQFQAQVLAEAGAKYQDILSVFFKNAGIDTMKDEI